MPFKEIIPQRLLDVEEGKAFRPGYHIIAPTGWMNDPVGIFEFRNVTHVFFQVRPKLFFTSACIYNHSPCHHEEADEVCKYFPQNISVVP